MPLKLEIKLTRKISDLRDISGKIRKQRKDSLEKLLGSYERALVKAKEANNKETQKNLEGLISKAKKDIKDLK